MNAIFVTGAASGIGRATALLFAERGYRVGSYDIDLDGARRTGEAVLTRAPQSQPRYGRLDVRDPESWQTALADFAEGTDRLDVLFNCAGVLRMGAFDAIPLEAYKQQLDVNVLGVITGIKSSLGWLERTATAHGGSTIVNMSSASAIYGQPELAGYSATKFAVRALTEALDLELAPRKIRVCDVMPGYVDTPMVHTQEHTATSLDRMGIKLTAEQVAETVWKAAHGAGLHHVPQTEMAAMSRLSGLFPEVSRRVMRRLTKR